MVELDQLDTEPLESNMAAGMLLRLEFEEWLSALEPAERELAHLRFVEGLNYEELAAVFDAPRGTIKSRLFYLKQKLCRSPGFGARGK
jgi:RNA polymerase sigma factor (sigma-70 family)